MKIKTMPFNPLEVNTYILHDESLECVIIDPSFQTEQEWNFLLEYIETKQLTPKHIILTHPHIDHLLGTAKACQHFNLPLSMDQQGESIFNMAFEHAQHLHLRLNELPDKRIFIKHKDKILFGKENLEVRSTPGHCDGSICLVSFAHKEVFTGDVLFRGSIGRTDLASGNFDTLKKSIYEQLFSLDDDFTVRPGHGGRTNIEYERHSNPFLN